MQGKPIEIITWLYSQDKDKEFEIKEVKKKRSLNANAYAWHLIGEISKAVRLPKEEIYKNMIKKLGKYEVLPIKNEAVETFMKAWQNKGVGWICEILGESKIEDYTNVVAYYGSSIYDTKEMSILLDEIVQEAINLEIPTKEDIEIEALIEKWNV